MTKYCSNCGKLLDENSPTCTGCGVPNPHYARPGRLPLDKLPFVRNLGRAGENKFRKRLLIAIGALAAAVVCFALLNIFVIGAGYKGVIKDYVKAVENEDGHAMVELTARTIIDKYGFKDTELARYYEQFFERVMENYEDRVGRDVKLKCKIDDFDAMDKHDRDDFIDSYEIMGYDMSQISKVAEVEIVIKAKGQDKKRSYEDDIMLVKESGKWKIWELPW